VSSITESITAPIPAINNRMDTDGIVLTPAAMIMTMAQKVRNGMVSLLIVAIEPLAILAGRRKLTMSLCLLKGQPALDDTA
jgi:hypothetical protein